MKKMLLLVVFSLFFIAIGSVPADAGGPATVSGYISCSTIAKGGATPSDGDAVRKCLEKGGDTVIVVDNTRTVLIIDNPDSVKGHEGHRVLLTGDITAGTIHVYSLRII